MSSFDAEKMPMGSPSAVSRSTGKPELQAFSLEDPRKRVTNLCERELFRGLVVTYDSVYASVLTESCIEAASAV
jgi:hypothetical protein